MAAPEGFVKLPPDWRCKCFQLWSEPDGSYWCCGAKPIIMPSPVSADVDARNLKVAQGLFDRAVFGLLKALGKFARQHVFFRLLGFDRRTKFCFHRFGLLAQQERCVVEIHGGRRFWRRDVREDHADFTVHGQLRLAAGAGHFECVQRLFRHGNIVRQIKARGDSPQRRRACREIPTKTNSKSEEKNGRCVQRPFRFALECEDSMLGRVFRLWPGRGWAAARDAG